MAYLVKLTWEGIEWTRTDMTLSPGACDGCGLLDVERTVYTATDPAGEKCRALWCVSCIADAEWYQPRPKSGYWRRK